MTSSQFKAWRLHLKLSKKRAAAALGLSQSAVDHYERGHRRDNADHAVVIPKPVALACMALAAGFYDYQGPG